MRFNQLFWLLPLCLWIHSLQAVEVFLVRHGETDWNVKQLIQGKTDIPLNDEGRRQAHTLAKQVKRLTLSACYSSDLQRTVETAKIILTGNTIPIELDARWRERDCGKWEGRPKNEYVKASSSEKEDVEKLESILQRIHEALDEIKEKHANEKVMVVTHGGIISHLMHDLLNSPRAKVEIRNGCLIQITGTEKGWKIGKVLNATVRKK